MTTHSIPLVVLGPGAVGRALLDAFVRQRESVACLHALRPVAVADSSSVVWRQTGLTAEDLQAITTCKADGGSLSEVGAGTPAGHHPWLAAGVGGRLPGIVVDTTAADTTAPLEEHADAGWGIVLANKVPLVQEMSSFRRITRGGRRTRWETTVAASLPVIAPLQGIVDAGDEIASIVGCVSGSLAFALHRASAGRGFAEIVAEALARGYLEPDPRTDLSGLDAARKALILARTIGWPASLDSVTREGLYPGEWDDLPRDEFLRRLPQLDERLRPAISAAAESGGSARYVVRVEQGAIRAGIEPVEADSPLGRTHTTDSTVVVRSRLFDANPLVVSGRGAGPAVTAAGVLADVVSLVRDI